MLIRAGAMADSGWARFIMDAEPLWILGKGMTTGAMGGLSRSDHPSLASLEGTAMGNRRGSCDRNCEWRLCSCREPCLQDFRYFLQILCRADYSLAPQASARYEASSPGCGILHGWSCQMFKRIGAALLWPLALAFLFIGFNKNDPYLISLRGAGNIAVAAVGIAVAIVLIRRGYWSSATRKILVLLWCLVPLSMLAAHLRFEWRRHDVLHSEAFTAHKLGRHFVVGYSSFDDVAALAEKGLIAGVYVTRHNLGGRSAEALKSE